MANLTFVSHIRQYVDYLHHSTTNHGSSSKIATPTLPLSVPLLGPRFLAPSPGSRSVRTKPTEISPEDFYIRPVNILHPFYLKDLQCPGCVERQASSVAPESSTVPQPPPEPSLKMVSWTAEGPRQVHGVFEEELAFGYQVMCSSCDALNKCVRASGSSGGPGHGDPKTRSAKVQTHWALTNRDFWKHIPHWKIPCKSHSCSHFYDPHVRSYT